MILFERFEPGDSTSYLLGCAEIPAGTGWSLGFGVGSGYLVACANFGHCVALQEGQRVDENDLRRLWPAANPWTIRAVLLWLSKRDDLFLEIVVPEVA